jgi:hypothetical protein
MSGMSFVRKSDALGWKDPILNNWGAINTALVYPAYRLIFCRVPRTVYLTSAVLAFL